MAGFRGCFDKGCGGQAGRKEQKSRNTGFRRQVTDRENFCIIGTASGLFGRLSPGVGGRAVIIKRRNHP